MYVCIVYKTKTGKLWSSVGNYCRSELLLCFEIVKKSSTEIRRCLIGQRR